MNNKKVKIIIGAVYLVAALVLLFLEYQRVSLKGAVVAQSQRYSDFTLLLYLSNWIIHGFFVLAGGLALLGSSRVNFFLALFGCTSLAEVYLNWDFYIVPSLSPVAFYSLLAFGSFALIIAYANFFKLKKVSLTGTFLALVLGIMIAYLPNVLITYYF